MERCFKSLCHFVLDTDSQEFDPKALKTMGRRSGQKCCLANFLSNYINMF